MLEIRFAQVSVQRVESRLSEVRIKEREDSLCCERFVLIRQLMSTSRNSLYVTLDLESSAARI